MKKIVTIGVLALAMVALSLSSSALGETTTWQGKKALWFAQRSPWHAPYAHWKYKQPVALVVPPHANMQTHWGWGVGNTRMTPINHQFQRPYPGESYGVGCPFYKTPYWPSDTDQFGVYYIRGPW